MIVQRDRAVKIIKEIGTSCKFLNPKEISLEPSGKPKRYEIHINSHVDESWECLKKLAKKHSLGVKLTDHTLVIYAPVSKKIGKLFLS
jgi:hypothetical protein